MSETDEIAAWLRSQAEADIEAAGKATPGPWAPEEPLLTDVVTSALLGRVADCSVGTGYRAQSLPDARHIARHDPLTEKARAESVLAVIDDYEAADGFDLEEGVHDGRDYDERERDEAVAGALDGVIRLLAAGYRFREGWKESWA